MAVFLELPVPVIQWTNLWDKEKVNQFGTRGCLLLPDESSTISRCSGSGRRGYTCGKSVLCKRKDGKDKTRFSHSPSHGALLTGGGGLVCLTLDAEIHDVVPKDSMHKPRRDSLEKHLDDYQYLQIAQLSTTMSQAQRATAFHFFTL